MADTVTRNTAVRMAGVAVAIGCAGRAVGNGVSVGGSAAGVVVECSQLWLRGTYGDFEQRRQFPRQFSGPAMVREGQKPTVVPSTYAKPSSLRWERSAAVISEKRHSHGQLVGRQPPDQIRKFSDELSGQRSPGEPHHVGGVDELAADANVPVLGQAYC